MVVNNRKIKLLIVDDSAFFRTAIADAFTNHPKVAIAGTAKDPYEARDKILALKPDVMTLDIEMPRMSGLEFLKILMPQHPLPVVMVSSLDGAVFDAMRAGAVDFIEKPSATSGEIMASFSREVEEKVLVAAGVDVKAKRAAAAMAARSKLAAVPGISLRAGLIALGASTGGTEATSTILRRLPANIPGMVITQHMPPVFTKMYAQRLDKECAFSVKEAEENDIVKPGHAYIAPGDRHLQIIKRGTDMVIHLWQGEKVNGHCPSVDVMFQSVAKFADRNTVGIILTGMGADGAQGLLEMKEKGAYTIGQDEASCVVYGMPMVAKRMGAVTTQAPLDQIADALMNYLTKRQA
ncbi:protein-glutamate methylesterase/protein-glutamine glutaminase [Christensenella intestinihominis]|uniref:protein-glutamate methylesterase/protein-glutamine glutaminase n=1 Tax=Christensenella intestinihominis TaxID=1851429 RepID=UPI00082F79EE|nr:chemotaxis response regulator protein-glutamate methylesterase [Christensenella intestinihominis]